MPTKVDVSVFRRLTQDMPAWEISNEISQNGPSCLLKARSTFSDLQYLNIK